MKDRVAAPRAFKTPNRSAQESVALEEPPVDQGEQGLAVRSGSTCGASAKRRLSKPLNPVGF